MINTVDGLLKQYVGGMIWMCGQGHILGVTIRKRSNGHWQNQLLKFRHAAKELSDLVEVDATIEGTVRNITCDLCPEEARLARTWYHNKEERR